MIIRGISLKHVAGTTAPAQWTLAPETSFHDVDPALAAALPLVVFSLLYPADASPTDMARLAGGATDSAWRLALDVGEERLRLARGFSLMSVVLERYDDQERSWEVIGRGAPEVTSQLQRFIDLPPPSVLRDIAVSTNAAMRRPQGETGVPNEDSRLSLISHDEYFGNLELDDGTPSTTALSPDDRQRTADEYRRARTWEALEDQIRRLEQKLQETLAEAGALVDSSGEFSEVTRRLAELPQLRALRDDEKDALTDPDRRRDDLDRRLADLALELETGGDGKPLRPWYLQPLITPTLVAGVALTLASLFGGTRTLALGNVFVLAITLFGSLRYINALERSGRSGRKRDAIERRRDQLESERHRVTTMREALRRELDVSDMQEYQRVAQQRATLQEREARLREQYASALSSPAYQKLDRRRERVQREIEERRMALARVETASLPGYELHSTLLKAGYDPEVVLWHPGEPEDEYRTALARAGAVALEYRLSNEQGMAENLAQNWRKLLHRVTGRPFDDLTLTSEYVAMSEGRDVLTMVDDDTAWAIVETLRLAVHMAMVAGRVPGMPRFVLRIHPFRVRDADIRRNLQELYEHLGRKLQVIAVSARDPGA